MTAVTVAHTKGPWHFNEIHTSVRSADNDPVALMMARTQEEDEANAKLIAASPSMADTLLWIRENLHPMALGRGATDAELIAISLATKVLREAGVIPTHVLTEREP